MDMVGEDKISELPESLILQILSLVPTKLAVSTTVLSKRWNNLWVSLPVLDFSERPGCKLTRTHNKKLYEETARFMDFLDRTLLSNNTTTIKKFCLHCGNAYFVGNRMRRWITALVKRNIEELFLIVKRPGPKLVPVELFTCESLTTLDFNFEYEHVLDFPHVISLPRLKVLRLSRVEFKDVSSMQRLFSNCPILEEFILCNCVCEKHNGVIRFSVLRLKYFVVEGSSSNPFGYNLNAPNPGSIKLNCWLQKDIHSGSFPSLIEFSISSGYYALSEQFVGMWSNVKLLKASHEFLKIFDREDVSLTSLPTFHNLMCLEVDYLPSVRSLFNFLHMSPNLESLAIDKVSYSIQREFNGNEFPFNTAPHCLLLHLKSIEFRDFKEWWMGLIKLILKHAQVLKLVTVRDSPYFSPEIMESLRTSPRASTHCIFQTPGENTND